MKASGTMPRALAARSLAVRSLALIGPAGLLPTGQSLAAKPASTSGGKFTCSFADPGGITVSTNVMFSGTVSGSTPPCSVTWTFPDATRGSVTAKGAQDSRLHASGSCLP
jgi:hypothetical protein